MSSRRFEDPPVRLVDEQGRIHFGTFNGPIPDVNLIDANPWPLPVPRALRWLRLKEWQAFQWGNARWFVAVALFNAKALALAQVKIYDREKRTKFVFERKLPGWALRVPNNVLHSQLDYQGIIRFVNRLDEGRIDIELNVPATNGMPALSGKVHALSGGCDPQVVSIPFPGNRGIYSHKACLPVTGELKFGTERAVFDEADSFLLMDDHKGYYPYVMRWDWVTGGGIDPSGRRIGFNLTRNDSIDPVRYNENCLWVDGRVYSLPPVRFVRKPGETPEQWEVRDDAGEVGVDFVIELDGYVKVNALVVESRYRGPFGFVRGFIAPAGAERIELDGLFGMGEDFHLRC